MIISPDKNNQIDGVVYSILKAIPSKIPLIPITKLDNFVFNEELLKLKEYILFDFCEYGANSWDRKDTHLFGKNTGHFKWFKGAEWKAFDLFVKNKPPLVYFKRELLQKDFSGNVYPIEFPCWQPTYAIQSQEDYNKRPIELFHYWGHSHESRRMFQGNAYIHAVKTGIVIADNLHYVGGILAENQDKRVWLTANVPHFARVAMSNIMNINNVSKLSLSLPGAGCVCFRHSESPVNSVMVMMDDNLAWSYPWIHGDNCIKVPCSEDFEEIRGLKNQWKIIESIEEALSRTDLYDIYVKGVHHIDKYRPENYTQNYILPIIKEHS